MYHYKYKLFVSLKRRLAAHGGSANRLFDDRDDGADEDSRWAEWIDFEFERFERLLRLLETFEKRSKGGYDEDLAIWSDEGQGKIDGWLRRNARNADDGGSSSSSDGEAGGGAGAAAAAAPSRRGRRGRQLSAREEENMLDNDGMGVMGAAAADY